MSKIGRRPVTLLEGVTAKIEDGFVSLTGPKGELRVSIQPSISVSLEEGKLTIKPKESSLDASELWGTARAKVQNAVLGVKEGYKKELKLVGLGYRVTQKGNGISLAIGFSHPVEIAPPPGVTVTAGKEESIIVSGVDKGLVGQLAAKIRAVRPPEPYKGKGIVYVGEVVRRKAGKAGKVGVGGAAK